MIMIISDLSQMDWEFHDFILDNWYDELTSVN
jgi:hypothetical protein